MAVFPRAARTTGAGATNVKCSRLLEERRWANAPEVEHIITLVVGTMFLLREEPVMFLRTARIIGGGARSVKYSLLQEIQRLVLVQRVEGMIMLGVGTIWQGTW
jgi:hypothetical protein